MKFISNTSRIKTILHPFVLFYFLFSGVSCSHMSGMLTAKSASYEENFCMVWFEKFGFMPNENVKPVFAELQNHRDLDWCSDHPDIDVSNKFVMVQSYNCSFLNVISTLEDRDAKGIILVSTFAELAKKDPNTTFPDHNNITLSMISDRSANQISEMENPEVYQYIVVNKYFDYSIVFIFVISMLTIFVGGYWSGVTRHTIFCRERGIRPVGTSLCNSTCSEYNRNKAVNIKHAVFFPIEQSAVQISPAFILCLVSGMVCMMLLMYFFFDYFYYVVLFIFVTASFGSVYCCLDSLVSKLPIKFYIIYTTCFKTRVGITIGNILVFIFAASISIYWLIARKQRYAWILQDVLGVTFCLNFLKSLRMPNLKIITILLVLLFVYDVFFVFVTPYITGKKESIMEEVAFGGKSSLTIPMLLRIAPIGFNPLNMCFEQGAILGFGDILVPGLLCSYLHGFDIITGQRKRYFILSVCSYGMGMLLTFAALFYMQKAQPALLYLVPCILIPPVLLAWYRKDLNLMWKGLADYMPPMLNADPTGVRVVPSVAASAVLENPTPENSLPQTNATHLNAAHDHEAAEQNSLIQP